ncbi:hypothetical protein HGA91_02005 [candidate division WWE3 bacterium]|nr:hypothetical protein [candidate division WWE3 bacterium]
MNNLDSLLRPPWMQPWWVLPLLFVIFLLSTAGTIYVAVRIGEKKILTSPTQREYVIILLIGLVPIMSCAALSFPFVFLGPIWGGVVVGIAVYVAYRGRRAQIEKVEEDELLSRYRGEGSSSAKSSTEM